MRDVILDGETLALDEDGGPRPFQETMSRFGANAARTTLLHPWFFDVLHIDGRDLLDEPLSTRIGVLERIAPGHRIPGRITADPAVAEQVSRDALAAGHEGVVVKAVGSAYAAGRRGSNWIKVKPVLTYDLVVLACEWGSGRRTGLLSNLHLGALDPIGEFGEPGGYVMVGKTFKGLTDALLRWQTEQVPGARGASHGRYGLGRADHRRRDRHRRRAAVPRYPGGIALRFARVKRYRDDKTAAEADTIQTLRALLHTPPGRKVSPAPVGPDSGRDAPSRKIDGWLWAPEGYPCQHIGSERAGTSACRRGGCPEKPSYRPEIQGLRSLAVLIVVTYHVWFGRWGGVFHAGTFDISSPALSSGARRRPGRSPGPDVGQRRPPLDQRRPSCAPAQEL